MKNLVMHIAAIQKIGAKASITLVFNRDKEFHTHALIHHRVNRYIIGKSSEKKFQKV